MKKLTVVIVVVMMLIYPMQAIFVCAGDTVSGDRVEQIMADMTTEEKIAQTLMVDFRKWNGEEMVKLDSEVAAAFSKYHFGGVILFKQNIKNTKDTLQLTKDLQAASIDGGGLPLLTATDQEGGIVYRLTTGTALPGNMAIAAGGETDDSENAGMIIGEELSSLGINVNLAPVMDVNSNANNPVIGLRSFSDSPDVVGSFGSAMFNGLKETGTAGCVKHFPGHGDTDTDSHYGLPVVNKTLEELKKTELKSFQTAIDNDVEMVMTAHILYPKVDDGTTYSQKTGKEEKHPATMSKIIISDILKTDMGFKGVVITDGMDMKGLTDTYGETQAVVESLKAGVDVCCMPASGIEKTSDFKRIDDIIAAVKDALDKEELSEDRLDDAVRRILELKEKRGILDYDASEYTEERALSTVGNADHREQERQISARAVTVVKNNDVLPLSVKESSKVMMICPRDDQEAQMIMGWNRAKKAGLIPEGATVRYCNYTKDAYEVSGGLKDEIDWADTVIVLSDVTNASRMTYDDWYAGGPQNIVNYCHNNGKKALVVSVNKPYDTQLYSNADAIIAVYGNKGSTADAKDALENEKTSPNEAFGPNIIAGVEVILGTFEAKGTLPVSVPEYDSKLKTFTDNEYYQRGHSVKSHFYTAELSEDSVVYNGSVQKPDVTVSDSLDGTLEEGKDYTVSYDGDFRDPGKYSVIVKGTGTYSFYRELKYSIKSYGWTEIGTCEWQLTGAENKKTLTIRPEYNGESGKLPDDYCAKEDWPWDDERANIKKVVFYGDVKAGNSTSEMFTYCQVLKRIDGLENLDTTATEDMNSMFYRCSALDSFDVSEFNTSNVTNMNSLFSKCGSTYIDVSGFDTSKVTNMGSMFSECREVESLDISGFDTSKVTEMSGMFNECNTLESLDLSGFDTSQVTGMVDMFNECYNLESLNVSWFDTSQVTSMQGMFQNCRTLESLDLSYFDTSKVTDMYGMFQNCFEFKKLDLSSFDTSKVTDMNAMFWQCRKLKNLDVSEFNTSEVTDMGYMFAGCSKLEKLDLSSFDTSKVENMEGMFHKYEDSDLNMSLKTVSVSGKWTVENVTDGEEMFTGCTSLVGGEGTKYNSKHVDKEYARIDYGDRCPGYFTEDSTPTPVPATKYTVTFDNQGHGDAIPARIVKKGEKFGKPADLKAEGYVFGGWFTDKICTVAWNFNKDVVTKDMTLYAKWTKEGKIDIGDYILTLLPEKFAFNNKVQKPRVIVEDDAMALKKGKEYIVEDIEDSVDVGRYDVVIKGIGEYEGALRKEYVIRPASKAVKSISAGKKKLIVKWKKSTKAYRKQTTVFQIKYSTSKKFKNAEYTYAGPTAHCRKIKGLKANKKYYVKMRVIKYTGGENFYSKWSKVKVKKTK